MDSRSPLLAACVTVYAVLAAPHAASAGGELLVTVTGNTVRASGSGAGSSGGAIAGTVVIAEPLHPPPKPRGAQKAVMDQRNLQFVPDVLIVRSGTAVDFPNSDQVRHQVYSFSPAKKFELSLYAGREHAPVIFDTPGLVTLGCNIHDNMLGYIWVTDSPWYGRTSADGGLRLQNLAPGDYRVHIWHALLNESGPQLEQRVSIVEGQVSTVSFRLTRALRSPAQTHANKQWEDY